MCFFIAINRHKKEFLQKPDNQRKGVTIMNDKLKINVRLDYLYCFLKNTDLTSAVWVLYLIYKGLPLWQVGILEAVFHITGFLSELPTGALADLFGRKRVLIAGRICSLLSCLLMLLSNGFAGFAAAFVFSAWGYNLNSGSEEALVYDSMKLTGKEAEYLTVNGRLNVIIEASQGLSTCIGGILSEYSYLACYLTAAVVTLLSMLPAFLFREPEYISEGNINTVRKGVLYHFKECGSTLRGNRKVQSILLYYPITFTFYTVMFFYSQKYFNDYGLNKIHISIIMLIGSLLSCTGAISCNLIQNRFRGATKYLSSLFMGISIMGLYLHHLNAAVVFFAVSGFMNAMLYPIQSDSLNRLIPSEQRATILSVSSMLFSCMMIVIFPVTGFTAEIIGLHKTFLLLGFFQLLLIPLLAKRVK